MKCNNFFCKEYKNGLENNCFHAAHDLDFHVKDCKQRKAFNKFKNGLGTGYYSGKHIYLPVVFREIKKELAK